MADTTTETPTLKGRTARCGCGESHPSTTDGLAFFEYRGPGSNFAKRTCKHCRYHPEAHERKKEPGVKHLRHVCDHFEPDLDGAEFDGFYCGCRGWD